jgi:DNA processing protein
VVGTGLDTTYPPEHADLDEQIRRRGAVISQVPPGGGVHGRNFSARNALIAALSIASVIIVAAEQSGTRVELEHAVAQGKRVFLWHPLMSKADWPARIVERGDAEFATSVEDLMGRIRDIA